MQNEKPEWIIFFGEDWHGLNSTSQFLARELKSRYKILWFNSIGLREPRLTLYDFKRALDKVIRFIKPSQSSGSTAKVDNLDNIYLINPIAIPYFRFSLVRKINFFILKNLLLKNCKKYNIKSHIFITANPATADIMNITKPLSRIFYCADEYSEMPFMPKQAITKLENTLLKNVDHVFCTSKELVSLKKQKHNNVKYLPHGVCYEHMASTINIAHTPKDIELIKKPTVGYVGLIGQHLDLAIIKNAAERLPNYNFIFIGPIEDGTIPPKADNIFYLGPKPYSEVPSYLANFDVALLPWNNSDRNKYAHPTKIREYLSAGLATVCTPHPEIENLSDAVSISNDAEEFSKQIESIANNFDSKKRENLSKTMHIHDWSYRAKELEELINAQ